MLLDGSALFDNGETATILADPVLDRGSLLRVDFEEAQEKVRIGRGGNACDGVPKNLCPP